MPDTTLPEDILAIKKDILDLKEGLDQLQYSFTKKTGGGSNDIQGSMMQSVNFKTGISGWCLTPNGDLEANNGNFRGDITGASGHFSGTVDVASINIPDAVTANSFHVNSAGDAWWGAAAIGDALAKVLKTGAATFTNVTITGGSVASSVLNTSVMRATSDIVFTSTDNDTVAWSAGSIRTAAGVTYNISGGNTGNISALTYIYLDTTVSVTVLQTTTVYSTAVGDGKILVATAQNASAGGAFCVPYLGAAPLINGGSQINASSILAAQISVSQLSAITANLGTITTGTITFDTAGYLRGGQTDFNTGVGFFLGYSGAAYKFSIGDPNGNYLTWDGSSISIQGNFIVGANNSFGTVMLAGESITAGNAIAAGYYQSDGGIKFDSKTSGATASTSSISQALTVANNSNRVVIAILANVGNKTYSNVQFGGANMTLIDSLVTNPGNHTYVYYIVAPAAGSQNFTATASGATVHLYALYSYFNVAQTGTISTHNIVGIGTNDASYSLTATPAEAGDLILQYDTFDNNSSSIYYTTSAPNNAATAAGSSPPLTLSVADNGQSPNLVGQVLTYTRSGTGGNPWIEYGYIGLKPFTAVSYGYVVKASSALAKDYSTPASATFRQTAFIGFAANSASAGQNVTVVTSGVAPGLSGLTPFAQYYLNDTAGTIGTAAGTISRKVGIATDATHLTITNLW